MGSAPALVPCCDQQAARVFGDFQFTEDRCRQFRNPVDGTEFSYSLGRRYPQSRGERDALFAQIGCEPVTPGTMPEKWKWHQEYAEHKRHGGERLPNDGYEAKPGKLTVLEQLRKSNVKFL
jgi:hypothetical protein